MLKRLLAAGAAVLRFCNLLEPGSSPPKLSPTRAGMWVAIWILLRVGVTLTAQNSAGILSAVGAAIPGVLTALPLILNYIHQRQCFKPLALAQAKSALDRKDP